MSRTTKVFSLILALLFLCTFQALWAGGKKEAERVYINGIDADFPPFGYMDESGKPAGFDVESVDWIAKEMGFKVKHKPIAWDGIVEALRSGKIDLVASGMTITEERKKVVDFTIPYWEIKQAVIVNEDSNLNSLDAAFDGTHQIGTQRGCTAAMWIEDNLVQKGTIGADKLVLHDSFSISVKDLLNRRIEAAMMDDVMIRQAIKGKPLKIIGTIDTGEIYGYAVRKEDAELKEMLNEGLRKLKASPKWDELIEKYMNKQ